MAITDIPKRREMKRASMRSLTGDKEIDEVAPPSTESPLQPISPNVENEVLQGGKGQSLIDIGTKHLENVMTGDDATSQRLLERTLEQSAATQSALRGMGRQQAQMQGLSGVAQNIMGQMQDRQLAAQESQTIGGLADVLGQRVDAASGKLVSIGTQERSWERGTQEQIMQDILTAGDITNPADREKFESQYEATYGVKPSMDMMVNKQWEAKGNQAFKDVNIWLTENAATAYNEDGTFNMDKIMSSPAGKRAIEDMWKAENRGGGAAFDPSNPNQKAWLEDTIKNNTTKPEQISFDKAMNEFTNSDAFKNLGADQQKLVLSNAQFMRSFIGTGIPMKDLWESIGIGGGEQVGGAESRITVDKASGEYVGPDGTRYKVSEGKIVDSEGKPVDPKSDLYKNIAKEAGVKIPEFDSFDPANATSKSWTDFYDAFESGTVGIDDVIKNIEIGKGNIPDNVMRKIAGNPEALKAIMESGSIPVGSQGTTGNPKESGNRSRYPDFDNNVGNWVNWNGELVKVMSSENAYIDSMKKSQGRYRKSYQIMYPDGRTVEFIS